jgi:hypothetical protein
MGVFDPSPTLSTYDRGTQAPILTAVSGANAPVNNAAPAGSIVYAIPPSVPFEQTPPTFTFQIDASAGATLYQFTAYGSLDGVNFYSLGTLGTAGTPGLFTLVDKKVRFLTAALTTAVTGGTASCSFAA